MDRSRQRRSRIPDEKWEEHELIIRQYAGEKKLEGDGGLIDTMQREHNFSASKAQYETIFRKWNIRKYATKDDWSSIMETLDARERQGGENSEVYLFNKRVEKRKIEKERKRYQSSKRQIHTPIQPSQNLPEYVSIRTPSPPISSLVIRTPSPQYSLSIWPPPTNNAAVQSPGVTTHQLSGDEDSFRDLHPVYPNDIIFNQDFSWPIIPDFISGLPLTRDSFSTSLLSDTPSSGISFAPPREQGILLSYLGSLEKTIIAGFREVIGNSTRPRALGDFSKIMFTPGISSHIATYDPDLGSIYTVISAIINGHMRLENLAEPSNSLDNAIKKVIMYFNDLGIRHFNEVLTSFPSAFLPSLEAGLFGAAVELGASKVVEAILTRGLDPTKMSLRYYEGTYTPLQRAYINGYLDITRAILASNLGPNKGQPILLDIEHQDSQGIFQIIWNIVDMEAEMIALLLQSGLTFTNPAFVDHYSRYDFPRLKDLDAYLKFMENVSDDDAWMLYKSSFLNQWFRLSDSHMACKVIIAILDRDWDQQTRDSKRFQEFLTISLDGALEHKHGEAFYELLRRGAQPDSTTLCRAIVARDLAAIRHLLEMGISISERDQFYHIAPIAEVILADCADIWNLIHQHSTIWDRIKDYGTFTQCIIAACKTGNGVLLEKILVFLDSGQELSAGLDERISRSGSYEVAIQSGNEFLVPKLLANGILPSLRSLNAALWFQKFDIAHQILDVLANEMFESPGTCSLTLSLAIHRGCLDVIRAFLDAGAGIDCYWKGEFDIQTGHDGETARVKIQDGFMRDEPCLRPAVTTAILRGKQEVFAELLEFNAHSVAKIYADPSNTDLNIVSPLAAAVHVGDLEMVKRLIKLGADPCDSLALKEASTAGRYEIVVFLMKKARERTLNVRRTFGADILIWAIENEDIKMVHTLAPSTDAGSFVSDEWRSVKTGKRNLTAFGTAVCSTSPRSSEMIEILLLHGANPNGPAGYYGPDHINFVDILRVTPILLAIYIRRMDMFEILELHGADINAPARSGIQRTPLQAAVEVGALDIVEYLLAKGVNVNEPPAVREGRTALQLAAKRGFIGIAALLIERGAEVNAPPCQFIGRTAFEAAAEYGRMEMLMYLVEKRADIVSDNGKQYRHAIQFAKANGHHGVVEYVEKVYREQSLNMALPTSFLDLAPSLGLDGMNSDISS